MLGNSEFDPAKATGVFRIEASDWGATVLVPGLARMVAVHAPRIQIDVIPRQSGYEALEANEVDLILGSPLLRPGNEADLVRSESLLQDEIVCLMRKGHPLAKRRLTLQEYVKAQHVSLSITPSLRRLALSFSVERQPAVAQALDRLGEKPNVIVRVPYFTSLGLIVAKTDLIATLPLHIARRVKSTKTCIVPAPSEFLGVSYHQIWHSRNDLSPIHQWVRGGLRDLAAKVTKERTAEG